MTQLTFSSNFYWKICFKFCILEQIIITVLFICISSINNKKSLLRFQSTTAPTNRGWSACDTSSQTFPGKPSCRYFTAVLLFWKLVTSSSGFHAANSKPSSRLEISLTQECGCSRCASTDSVTKTVLNV